MAGYNRGKCATYGGSRPSPSGKSAHYWAPRPNSRAKKPSFFWGVLVASEALEMAVLP